MAYFNGKKVLSIVSGSGSGASITVDDRLSLNSENPVQNKVVTQALNEKATKAEMPTKTSDLTNDSGFATTDYVDNAVASGGSGSGGGGANATTFSLTVNAGTTYEESFNKGWATCLYIDANGEIKEWTSYWYDQQKTINGIVKILNLHITINADESTNIHAYSAGSPFYCIPHPSMHMFDMFDDSVNIEGNGRNVYLRDIYATGDIVIDFKEIISENS